MQVEYTVDCVVEWEETEDIPLLKLEAILVKRGQAIVQANICHGSA